MNAFGRYIEKNSRCPQCLHDLDVAKGFCEVCQQSVPEIISHCNIFELGIDKPRMSEADKEFVRRHDAGAYI